MPVMLDVTPHADGGDVGLVVHAPHAAVTDDAWIELGGVESRGPFDSALLAKHDIVRA